MRLRRGHRAASDIEGWNQILNTPAGRLHDVNTHPLEQELGAVVERVKAIAAGHVVSWRRTAPWRSRP